MSTSNATWSTDSKLLEVLPTELIIDILEELDAISLLECRLVCRKFRDMIAEAARLTYKIELAIAEQEDGTNHNLGTKKKLELLRNWQARWTELDWSSETRYPMARAGLWELFGNVLAQNTMDGSFAFVQLPSESRGIPERIWTVKPDTPAEVRDFGIDPSQDLLVLIDIPRWVAGRDAHHRIYIRTMSTAKKHPLASGPGLIEHPRFTFDLGTSYSIKISSDNLAIFFRRSLMDSSNEFVIWDWRTGRKKLHLIDHEMESFCLLSERHVLLSVISDTPEGYDQAGLLVVDFEQEGSVEQTLLSISHCFKFSLPALHTSTRLRSFAISSDPSPSWVPRDDILPSFHKARDSQLLVVSIWVQTDSLRHLTLLVPRDILLPPKLGRMIDPHSSLTWEAWGPQGTRITERFTRDPSFEVWACHNYGTKFVLSECSDRTDLSFALQVFDFNQKALRNAITQGQRVSGKFDVMDMDFLEYDTSFCITAPTIFPAGEIFEEEVRTSLPFRWIAKSMPSIHPNAAVMCSEDSIVVVEDSPEDTNTYRVFSI
ncbi:hypothetical protein EV360DRAFT_79966 [Lentinula raphanica]|nr:hypothetical protein EV360DRAFT_79966 [Lentinula raphanica]